MENILIKEACVTNYLQAQRAFELGANRLELCFDMANGGTTPSFGTAKQIKEKLNIPVFCMIRPRGGNFIFDKNGVEAVNIAEIKKIFIERISDESWEETKYFQVAASLSFEDAEIILEEFKSEDEDKNFSDAKKYLAELIQKLNLNGKHYLIHL